MKTLWLAPLLLLLACQPSTESAPAEPAKGREETRGIRNTEAVGYPGEAMADKIDGALDAHDQHRQQLDAQLRTAEQPE